MKSPHEIALSIARLIRDSLHVDDGYNRPCLGNTLSPQWVAARSANIAQAIVGNYDVRELAVSGEIQTVDASSQQGTVSPIDEPPLAVRSRYGFGTVEAGIVGPAGICTPHWIDCGEMVAAEYLRNRIAMCDACAAAYDKRKEG